MWALFSSQKVASEPTSPFRLEISEEISEKDFSDLWRYNMAYSLNSLAELYRTQGKYSEAEPLYKREIDIREKLPRYIGAGSYQVPNIFASFSLGNSLNNLADLYRVQGKYTEAEPLYKRSLEISEEISGKDSSGFWRYNMANSLNGLAELYRAQKKYAEAEPLYKRSLKMMEKALGPNHPGVADVLDNLAMCCREMGKLDEAENLEVRAKKIRNNLDNK
jgi:tetratricopeptide (TPR) repeat protein